MKIRMAFTVEVDPDAWVNTYGCAREDVREDVRSYLLNQITQSVGAEETGLEVVSYTA